MIHPHRAERLWLVLALALLWLVRLGGQVHIHWQRLHSCAASLSYLTLGWLSLYVHALQHRPLPAAAFFPFDWPKAPL